MNEETISADQHVAVAGSGAIACGLAATAAHHGPVLLLARSQSSADRALATVEKTLARLGAEVDPEHVQIVTDPEALAPATFVVEAVVEDHEIKAGLLAELNAIVAPEAILSSTTSSLSIERLAEASGRPERFVGLHVFNPVTKMKLVELIFPKAAGAQTRRRALALCETLEKTPVEVPDVPGFVVNKACKLGTRHARLSVDQIAVHAQLGQRAHHQQYRAAIAAVAHQQIAAEADGNQRLFCRRLTHKMLQVGKVGRLIHALCRTTRHASSRGAT